MKTPKSSEIDACAWCAVQIWLTTNGDAAPSAAQFRLDQKQPNGTHNAATGENREAQASAASERSRHWLPDRPGQSSSARRVSSEPLRRPIVDGALDQNFADRVFHVFERRNRLVLRCKLRRELIVVIRCDLRFVHLRGRPEPVIDEPGEKQLLARECARNRSFRESYGSAARLKFLWRRKLLLRTPGKRDPRPRGRRHWSWNAASAASPRTIHWSASSLMISFRGFGLPSTSSWNALSSRTSLSVTMSSSIRAAFMPSTVCFPLGALPPRGNPCRLQKMAGKGSRCR